MKNSIMDPPKKRYSPDLTGGRQVSLSTESSPTSRRSKAGVERPSRGVPDRWDRPRSQDLFAIRVERKAVVRVLLLSEVDLGVLPGVAVVEGGLLHPVRSLRHLPHRPDHGDRPVLGNGKIAAICQVAKGCPVGDHGDPVLPGGRV